MTETKDDFYKDYNKSASNEGTRLRSELKPLLERMVQSVILTFNDGTTAVFSGRAVCEKGDAKTITDIKFTEPKDLPDNYYWESL